RARRPGWGRDVSCPSGPRNPAHAGNGGQYYRTPRPERSHTVSGLMRQLWPHDNGNQPSELGEGALEELYRYPERWLAVNFVSSADGAVELAGHSAGLSTAPDRVVYQLGSDLADVVLLGA